MAKKERLVPLCGRCGHRHYNNFGKGCPPQPSFISRQPAPEGFRVLSGFGESKMRGGVNTAGNAAVVYRLPPRPRSGSLTDPDGTPHTPAA